MVKSRLLGAFGIVAVVGGVLAAQAPESPKFEVASIKLNKLGPNSIQRVNLLPGGDRVSIENVPALTLVKTAYDGVTITGGPKWMGTEGQPNFDVDRFDVTAKAEKPSTAEQLRQMLQTLLADRFKLQVHVDRRSQRGFKLVRVRPDRLGPHLKPAAQACTSKTTLNPQDAFHPIDPCGTFSIETSTQTGHMSARGLTLDNLRLRGILFWEASGSSDSVVDNETGLEGPFDWDLVFMPRRFLNLDRAQLPPDIDPDGVSILTAIQEQLGLKLESSTVERAVLVIDHVERPTED